MAKVLSMDANRSSQAPYMATAMIHDDGHAVIERARRWLYQRLDRAKALLESSRLSLEDITGRCGYEDASTFSKVFKHWAHVTPRKYRIRFGLRQ